MPPSKGTILVIEDDPSIRTGLEMNLQQEGYEVLSAEDGVAGLMRARSAQPDLILLDIMLPKRSGLEVLAELRRAGLDTPVLLLTALGLERDKVKGLRMGADDYITKPFGLAELLARVHAVLRRSKRHDPGQVPLCFGELEILHHRREVRRSGRPLRLTSREYDLLIFLARRTDRALTREQILQGVWGLDYEGTPRTVDNFIRALRTKVEPDPARPIHILTVHGLGYRFTRGL